MAFEHISFNDSTKYGSKLRNLLNLIEQGDDAFLDVRDVIIRMRDGADNAGDHSNYAEVVKRFGFGDYDPVQGAPTAAQCTLARNAFLEIDSAFSKTSGNGSVSDVRAARDQLLAKLR